MSNLNYENLTLNRNTIPAFLDMFPNQDTKIFMCIALSVLPQVELSIDVSKLAEATNLPDHVVHLAIEYYLKHNILIHVENLEQEDVSCTNG